MNESYRVLTLVFTDLAGSTALKAVHGDRAVDALISRHRDHIKRLSDECAGRVIDWAGDGCFLTFDTSSAAVLFALRLQLAHADEPDLPRVRIGVHLGEVTESTSPDGAVHVKGLAVDIAARIQSLAMPGQILMSTAVQNSARQRLGVETLGRPVVWQAHGTYTFKGFEEPMEIREAGVAGVAPMRAPESGEKARRVAAAHRSTRMAVAVAALITIGAAAAFYAFIAVRAEKNTGPVPRSMDALGPIGSADAMELEYQKAKLDLMKSIRERQSVLDPTTVATINENLELIETAIRDIRFAIQKDPGNKNLNDMLLEMHQREIEFLEQASRLPVSRAGPDSTIE